MKLTNETFETIRPNEQDTIQPAVIRPKNTRSAGTGLSIGGSVKSITIWSVVAITLAIAWVLIVPQPRSNAALNDISVGIGWDETGMPCNQGTYSETQVPIFLPSPNSSCATIVAEIAMR